MIAQTRVAIVIPCYKVEDYLDECLASVVAQTYPHLDIIVIDDGSPDRSGEIADEWATRDDRISVIHQENGGLGAARNAGVQAADADFLFFLDSDDLLPVNAIELLVGAAQRSGSDLVSGVAYRFNSESTWRSGMYKAPFRSDKLGTHLFHQPDLLYDHIACSKLYRTTWWHEQGFEFPTGVLFEDIALVTAAHVSARQTDLIASCTYLWRDREFGETSITQERTAPGSTTARFAALRKVDAHLRDNAPEDIWDRHTLKAFSLDAPTYCALTDYGDEEYLAEFVDGAGNLADMASARGVELLSPLNRLLWTHIRNRDHAQVRQLGRVYAARNDRHMLRAAYRLANVEGADRRWIAVTEAKLVRRRVVPRIKRRVRRSARAVAIPIGRQLFRSFSKIRPTSQDLDEALVVTQRDRQRARRLAQKVRLSPRPARAKAGRRPTIGTVGSLQVDILNPRDGSLIVSFDGVPVTLERVQWLHPEELISVPVPIIDGRASLDVRQLERFGRPALFRPATWDLVAVDLHGALWRLSARVSATDEFTDEEAGASYRVRANSNGVLLTVGSLLPTSDRGAVSQELIQEFAVNQIRQDGLTESIFYESFYGRSVGCHPLALYRELRVLLPEYDHVFAVQPGYTRVPDGARSALRWTRSYHDALLGSQLVISNCELHRNYERTDGQFVLQTWHGTPLKRIGLDIDSPKFRNDAYQTDLDHQVSQWSAMLSPTPDTDIIFRRAFGYEGDLWSDGNPRNDLLINADEPYRSRLRDRLGLTEGQHAILYAPTFRDDQHGAGGYKLSQVSELTALLRALPSDTVVLFRAHSNIRNAKLPIGDPHLMIVSDYPDMQDLIVAADSLVTDYSSTLFDWALTRKPVALYAPDLAQYRDVRDFYYDYEAAMPTEVTTTIPALADQIRAIVSGEQRPDTSSLIETFANRDHGDAAKRIAAKLVERL